MWEGDSFPCLSSKPLANFLFCLDVPPNPLLPVPRPPSLPVAPHPSPASSPASPSGASALSPTRTSRWRASSGQDWEAWCRR